MALCVQLFACIVVLLYGTGFLLNFAWFRYMGV
jgi:hypothetical protein